MDLKQIANKTKTSLS